MRLMIKILAAVLAVFPYALHAQSPGSFSSISGTSTLSVGQSITNTGGFSMAIGDTVYVTGESSAGIGYDVSVTGSAAFAAGEMASASNWGSVALNYAQAAGEGATALNDGYAFGSYSTAINYAQTVGSKSFGQGKASVGGAFAAGFGETTVPSYASVALGQFNDVLDSGGGPVNGTQWDPVDPVLSVGIGLNASARQDAFTIYKDGKIRMTKRQGDIPMGQFGNGSGD